jgi:nicotinate-nucleotide adenylyltransferase
MRIAVYGGSFNPPHVVHLMVAEWLRWTDRCDEVWCVPVRGHPFAKDLVPYDHRLVWCADAVRDLPGVRASDVERGLPVPSYTVDTLTALARRHPEHSFRLVIGADVLPEAARWKAWDRIVAEYRPIVVGRQGYPTPAGAIDFPGVSSTEIRRRADTGEPIEHLVPSAIVDRVRSFYTTGAGARSICHAPRLDGSAPCTGGSRLLGT